ncbi:MULTISPECIES: spore germination protein [Cytobacillus]|uniref:spore germination protein n=1 Tax=Cytobacillus TaxID=2675230 RepID=UPI00203CA82F|nr:spore germination protein [Cytobacillus oceanisediminis]MCM3243195.1 spore germination protein [Cytobacillus oceanisediminis]MDK7665440.1 spore germination protein [Cytobacillus oceanisediminis]
MFWKKEKKQTLQKGQQNLSLGLLKEILANLEDAEIVERQKPEGQCFTFIYIRTLIDQERMNEALFEPLLHCTNESIQDCISTSKAEEIFTLGEAEKQLLAGSVIIFDSLKKQWWSVLLTNNLGRSIETSDTETILYGAKDSFSEQLDTNITLIRRRLPVTELKSEKLKVGSLSETTVVLMYMEGVTNPEFVAIAKEKINKIDFDLFFDSSQIAAFMEDHQNSIFPQFQQTDRPDVCAYSLGIGKLIILVDNTPFVLIGPVTFFHLFQSPEDYINRWPVASFLRLIRYISFILSITLIPLYVALTTHHYQMLPLQILFVLVESRSKLPFTPFWEALLMLIILEIIKEASLRMPTKSSQTLGVIGGIVIGQAAVEAGFASKVLIVLVGVSAIASFLVPNYLMTKANTMIQFVFLLLSSFLGVFGIVLGMIIILAHLNSLTSLRQPYFAPVAPLYWKDWIDLFIRGPLTKMKTRPDHLHPFQKWRYSKRR